MPNASRSAPATKRRTSIGIKRSAGPSTGLPALCGQSARASGPEFPRTHSSAARGAPPTAERLPCGAPLRSVSVRRMLLVVAATERELERVHGADTLCCGVGPVEAALQTARRLARGDIDAVLHVGIAGARGIEPPALVLGSEAVYGDVIDASSAVPRIERIMPDARLLARVRQALPEAHILPIATSGTVGGGTASDVEAMEGFGVLRAAALAGVPAVELRAVSNAPEEADRGAWRFDDALAALADAVDRVVRAL